VDDLSDKELKEQIFKCLNRLLQKDTERYKRLMRFYLKTLIDSGEIYTPPPTKLTIKNPDAWTNSLWSFIHKHKN
jgi:hypothetical protein